MTHPATDLELQRLIPRSCERVFDAWLDAELMARFLCPAPGVTVRDVAVDARVGGAFSLTMVAGDTLIPIHGEYTAIERAHRLSFTWHSGAAGTNSEVVLTLEPQGEATLLTLRHAGLPSESAREAHNGGWSHILGLLAA